MTRYAHILPAANIAIFLLLALAFGAEHGGWSGDVPAGSGVSDVVTGDDGVVLFNRWQLNASNTSLPIRLFILLNAPALFVSQLVVEMLGNVISEFKQPFPFGLSYASYTILLGLLVSVGQWFGVGVLLDRIVTRIQYRREGR